MKTDLDFLKGYDTVIYGSFATGEFRKGSDIDVAVITKIHDRETNIEILKHLLGKAPEIYDIRIFELLSLKLKASVIDNFIVLYGDRPDISEYFYHYRKLWADCKHRIDAGYHRSYKDQINAIRRFERIKKRSSELTACTATQQ